MSAITEDLIGRIRDAEGEEARGAGEEVLQISALISTAASFYEKVRYLIDYREEHTIRRSATERILRRVFFIEQTTPDATELLRELAEGKYIASERVTAATIAHVDRTLEMFSQMIRESGAAQNDARKLISLAASEIDMSIAPVQYAVDTGCAEALYATVRPHIATQGLPEEFFEEQLYCASFRALLRCDDEFLSYVLWHLLLPSWRTGPNVADVLPKLHDTLAAINRAVADDLQWSLSLRLKNESIYFQVIRELCREKGSAAAVVMSDARQLEAYTRQFLERRYEKEHENIKRSGLRAVVYVLFTKLILVAVLEWPYEAFVLGDITYTPLVINALFHPLLLLALTRGVEFPGEDNTAAVVAGVIGSVRGTAARALRLPRRSTGYTFIFSVLYAVMCIGIFGAIVSVLHALNFTSLGAALFLFFLALVTYFAFRIRYRASQWRIVGEDSPFSVFLGLLASPIVRIGGWLSERFASINVLVILMDFILEMPFRFVLDFSDQFVRYLADKAEEVY